MKKENKILKGSKKYKIIYAIHLGILKVILKKAKKKRNQTLFLYGI